MLIRPYGIVLDGVLELGLELEVEGSNVRIRPHTGVPEPFVVSPSFVNAHSHLEYRGLQNSIQAEGYWEWIRELTARKREQSRDQVLGDCLVAAQENRATGVWAIAEHSDRPGSAAALQSVGAVGIYYQELITFLEQGEPEDKILEVLDRKRVAEAMWPQSTGLALHAPYTVDEGSLARFGAHEPLVSIHVGESRDENRWWQDGQGPIADFYRAHGFSVSAHGERVSAFLLRIDLLRPGVQWVHACDLEDDEIELVATRKVRIAHCPRSNRRLGSPPFRFRRMAQAGVAIGLGMDSAASSGPIDMFAEMRAALQVANSIEEPITAEAVWRSATDMSVLPGDHGQSYQPWIKIQVDGCRETGEVLERAAPDLVEWINT
jgi:cytosine/adenosine deaminase-related metal-dependent hydrolase